MSRRKQSDPEFLQHKAFQARVRARQKRTHEKYQLAFRRQQYAEATAEPTVKAKPPRNAIASVPNETPAVKLEGAAPPSGVEPTTQVGTSKAQALPAQHQDSTVAKLRVLTANSAMANLMAAYEHSPVAKLIATYEESPVAKLMSALDDSVRSSPLTKLMTALDDSIRSSPLTKLMTALDDSIRSSPLTKLMTALDDSIRSSPLTKLITQATTSVHGGRRQQEDMERITAPFEEFRRQQERITAPLRDVLTAVAMADPEQESIAGGATRSSRWEPPPYPDVSLDPTAEIKVEMLAMQKRVSELEEQLHKTRERSTPDAFPSKKRNSEPS